MKVEKETEIERVKNENSHEKSIRHQHHACNCFRSIAEIDENEMNIVCCSPWNRKMAASIAILVKALLFCVFFPLVSLFFFVVRLSLL